MNNLPTTGELFTTNQVSANTERCYKRQLHNFAEWMADSRDVHDMESISVSDLLAYRQSIQHLAAFTVAEPPRRLIRLQHQHIPGHIFEDVLAATVRWYREN